MLLPVPLVDAVELLETDSPPINDFRLVFFGLFKVVIVGSAEDAVTS